MEIATPTKASFREEFKRLLPERKVGVAWLVLMIAFAWFHWSSLRHLTGTCGTRRTINTAFSCRFSLWSCYGSGET